MASPPVIMARMTNDLNAVRMLLGPAIMYSANSLSKTAEPGWCWGQH